MGAGHSLAAHEDAVEIVGQHGAVGDLALHVGRQQPPQHPPGGALALDVAVGEADGDGVREAPEGQLIGERERHAAHDVPRLARRDVGGVVVPLAAPAAGEDGARVVVDVRDVHGAGEVVARQAGPHERGHRVPQRQPVARRAVDGPAPAKAATSASPDASIVTVARTACRPSGVARGRPARWDARRPRRLYECADHGAAEYEVDAGILVQRSRPCILASTFHLWLAWASRPAMLG